MKKYLLISLLAILFSGCELDREENDIFNDSDDGGGPPPISNNINDDDDNDLPSDGLKGDNTFLWKPVSESNGKLVVLIPANLSGSPVGTVIVNDNESGKYSGNHNGNRDHFRFSKPGSAYGNAVTVTLNKSGKTREWIVPNGSQRYSQRN